jgi:hypothetical protein
MHLTETQINDYADGIVSDDVAAHIAACAECAADVGRMRALLQDMAALPLSIAPERDLRAGIWQQIDASTEVDEVARKRTQSPMRSPRGTLWAARYRLAAAAVLLIAVSSIVTFMLVERNTPQVGGEFTNTVLLASDAHALEREYSDELQELQTIVRNSRGTLAPETTKILEDNLKIIDNAIGEARAALQADPNSGMLVEMLRSAYQKKLELLRQAAKSSAT